MRKTALKYLTPILLMALTVWCFDLLMLATGPQQDDFWYSRNYPDAFNGDHELNFDYFRSISGEYLTTWKQAIESCKNHYLYHDNARMANNLMLISNLAPEWLVDFVSAIFLVLLVWGIIRAACPRQKITPLLWGASLLIVFLFPWWEHPMICADFMMNYLWSTTILIWAWIAITGNPHKRQLWYLIPFCVFAGTMHEGLSASMIAGLFVYLILNRHESNGCRWILFGAVVFGPVFIIFSPALLWEFSRRMAREHNLIRLTLRILGIEYLNLTITAIALFVLRKRAGSFEFRKFLKGCLPFFVIVLVNYAVCFFSVADPRALWVGDIALAVVTMRAFIEISSGLSTKTGMVCGWISTLTVCAWFGMLSVWQAAASRNLRDLIETAKNSGDVIYFDLLSLDQFPFLNFNMICGITDINEITSALGSIDGLDKAMHKVVLPEKFRDIPFDSLPGVSGSARLRGENLLYFYSPEFHSDRFAHFDITYGGVGSLPGANPYSHSRLSLIFKKIRSSVSRIPDTYLDATLIPIVVTDDMKRRGICESDTAWFYGFHFIPTHYVSCKVEAIDNVESE